MLNGRQLDVRFSSDGLELVRMPATKVRDFHDDAEVKLTYFAELEHMLQQLTGCNGVRFFDVTRRTTLPMDPGSSQVRSPAQFVHGDQTPDTAAKRIQNALPEEAEHLLK